LNLHQLRAQFYLESYPGKKADYSARLSYLSRIDDLEETIKALRRKSSNIPHYVTQSGVSSSVMKDGPISTMVNNDNLGDVLGEEQKTADYGRSENYQMGQKHTLSVSDFFARPLQITDGTLALGAHTDIVLHIWDLYTSNYAVRAKLRNYAFLRGNMHVRIAIAGSPFDQGKLLASYQPWPTKNASLVNLQNLATNFPNSRPLLINYLSQSSGVGVIDIRENKPLEITCPFISTKPMHRLWNESAAAVGSATSFEDIQYAGDLLLSTINKPAQSSSSGANVYYYVYAWMTEVELGAPTGTQLVIGTQSDEREVGPVERLSSAVASISGKLMEIPVIKPYALASHITFSALEKLSAVFGWSKPIGIGAPVLVKNVAFQNGANTIGYDTNYKITLDPKQELTVDPRICASDEDELTINHISGVNTYLTSFDWTSSSTLMTPLFSCGVTPNLCTTYNKGATVYFVQPTAMAFAATPFTSWHGDIEFTVEIVVSQFHRGKLAIIYEPNVAQYSLVTANLDLNKQFVKIIDIQETQTVKFCVGWAQARAWAKMNSIANAQTTSFTTDTNGIAFGLSTSNYYNGFISIVPLTDLSSPAGVSANINIYVCCKDLMVNRMSNQFLPITRQNFPIAQSAEDKFSQPVSCVELNPSTADSSMICLQHYGERPVSFRSMLKRYVTTCFASTSSVTVALNSIKVSDSIMPQINIPFGSAPISPVTWDLFSYLRYAYVGFRGSVRKRIMFPGANQPLEHVLVRATLDQEGVTSNYSPVWTITPTTSIQNLLYHKAFPDGTISMDLSSNGGFEIELPYYSRNLFSFSFSANEVGPNNVNDSNMDTVWTRNFSVEYVSNCTSTFQAYMADCCAGEDFAFFHFQGAPPFQITGP
jgi:hypothetical protein